MYINKKNYLGRYSFMLKFLPQKSTSKLSIHLDCKNLPGRTYLLQNPLASEKCAFGAQFRELWKAVPEDYFGENSQDRAKKYLNCVCILYVFESLCCFQLSTNLLSKQLTPCFGFLFKVSFSFFDFT